MNASTNPEVQEKTIEETKAFVISLLERGMPAWAISYALGYVAADLGLNVCSDSAGVLSTVISAVAESARDFSEQWRHNEESAPPEVAEAEATGRPAGAPLH